MVDSQGNLTASNAALNGATISGGNIELADGSSIIGEGGILTNLTFYGQYRTTSNLGSK